MKFYRSLLLIFVSTTVIGLFIHLILFFINFGIPMEQERYLNEWLTKKDAYASSCTGRKIMFISGSNTLFGVDANTIEKRLGICTVNYGTHAALRFYTLERGKKHLQSGDIVILPLEYQFYTWHHDEYDSEFGFYILGYDKAEIEKFSMIDKLKFIAQQNTKDLAKFAYQRIKSPAHNEGGYSSQYLNANGDMTNNSVKKKIADSILQSKISNTVFNERPISDDAKNELTSFINYCKSNNIIVYAAWPNYLWSAKEFTGDDLEGVQVIENFYRNQNVEILGKYTDCLYDVDLFYDTPSHLNEKGKQIHTEYLIQLLKDKIAPQ